MAVRAKEKNERPRIGLVLAGGGSRGSYHIGVWKALREIGVDIDVVTGTSVGSLTAAIVAQGDYALAEETFSNITDEDVMAIPADKTDFTEVAQFLSTLAKKGGVDVTPLEKLLHRCIDEKKVRASSVKFGLVTVRKSDFSPLEITLDDMPEGTLVDYLLASSAIFPGFVPKKINGELYIDGGVFNNLPIGLAEDMGAEEIIAVDLEAIGIDRAYHGGLPVRYIRCYWPLGNIVKFDASVARRNIRLGYLDALKAFKRLDGYAYAFEAGELARFEKENGLAHEASGMLSGKSLVRRAAVSQLQKHCDAHRNDTRMLLALCEITGECLELDAEKIYTVASFNDEIAARISKAKSLEVNIRDLTDATKANQIKTMARSILYDDENADRLFNMLSATLPREYAAACYVAALKKLYGDGLAL